jgi:hypothetical protein
MEVNYGTLLSDENVILRLIFDSHSKSRQAGPLSSCFGQELRRCCWGASARKVNSPFMIWFLRLANKKDTGVTANEFDHLRLATSKINVNLFDTIQSLQVIFSLTL